MYLIVVGHCIIFGLGLYGICPHGKDVINLIPAEDMPVAMFIYCFCTCAVNCFVLISGYFGIQLTKKKFVNIFFALLFYSILLNTVPQFFNGNIRGGVLSLLLLSHSPYWFIIDYLFLMAFAPLLNTLFKRMSARYCDLLLLTMIIASCYFGFLWSHPVNTDGYTLFQFLMIYCIGRLIREREYNVHRNKAIVLFIMGCLITGGLMYLVYLSPLTDYTWRICYYNNPLVIFNAIMLFYIFLNTNIHSKVINYLASSSLAIYLVQSSQWVSSKMYRSISLEYSQGGYMAVYLHNIYISYSVKPVL